jgi:hypothetical protein
MDSYYSRVKKSIGPRLSAVGFRKTAVFEGTTFSKGTKLDNYISICCEVYFKLVKCEGRYNFLFCFDAKIVFESD